MSDTVLINGKEYSSNDVRVEMFGARVFGVTEISYSEKEGKKNLKGFGKEPIARIDGDMDYEASLTIMLKENLNILRAIPKGKKLTDIPPFPITVAYVDESGSNVTVIDKLKACQFLGNGREVKTGEGIMVKHDLIPGGIDFYSNR